MKIEKGEQIVLYNLFGKTMKEVGEGGQRVSGAQFCKVA